jgi:phosphatidylserine decarboxylase
MLANDSLAPLFVGGTVYQAYLSPLSYHRWHSPVNGTVTKVYVKDGTYYSEAPSEGFDAAGPNDSQAYITAVATRALIFIEADNPDIGLMCVLAVECAKSPLAKSPHTNGSTSGRAIRSECSTSAGPPIA